MARIQIISSDSQKLEALRILLEHADHRIQADRIDPSLREALLGSPPDAILIDLDRAPATGRDLGISLRIQAATRPCLLVYLDGKSEKIKAIRKLLPDAIYTRSETLLEDLHHGLANPPAEPHVPDSVFAGYAGRPLAAKLGIKTGMVMALIDAPAAFEDKLAPLPGRVQIQRGGVEHADMALWFTRHKSDLQKQLDEILHMVQDGKLWILWPKVSSGVRSDLTQKVVRQLGINAGWVDFKICAVDEIWSGLCFTARQPKLAF